MSTRATLELCNGFDDLLVGNLLQCPEGFFAECGQSGNVNHFIATQLRVQNTLQAIAADGEFARIDKKLVLTVSTIVPVPPAALLFGSALGILAWRRRRVA